jgi:hypothetical protein
MELGIKMDLINNFGNVEGMVLLWFSGSYTRKLYDESVSKPLLLDLYLWTIISLLLKMFKQCHTFLCHISMFQHRASDADEAIHDRQQEETITMTELVDLLCKCSMSQCKIHTEIQCSLE